MLIAITTRGPEARDQLDPHFGRAAGFTLIDAEQGGRSLHDNPHADGAHGAGIRAAEFVVGLGAQTVISGDVGPKAMAVLEEAGVACYAATPGTIDAALAAWQAGSLRRLDRGRTGA